MTITTPMDGTHGLAARWAVALGLITLATSTLLQMVPGPIPPPGSAAPIAGNTMLSFELALTPAEVMATLGPLDSSDTAGREQAALRRARLDHANRIDYAFMLAYSLYNAALALFAARWWSGGSRLLIASMGILLAIAMFAGDFIENEQLLTLSGASTLSDIEPESVATLVLWTRVKWIALALSAWLLAFAYGGGLCRQGARLTWLLPVAFAAAGVFTLLASAIPSVRGLLGPGAMLIAIAWFAALLHAAAHSAFPKRAA
jgi:hypothetical protein